MGLCTRQPERLVVTLTTLLLPLRIHRRLTALAMPPLSQWFVEQSVDEETRRIARRRWW